MKVTILDESRRRGRVTLLEHVLDADGARYQVKEIVLHRFRSESRARRAFAELTRSDETDKRKP